MSPAPQACSAHAKATSLDRRRDLPPRIERAPVGRLRQRPPNNKGTGTMMNLAEAAKFFSDDLPDEIQKSNEDALQKAVDMIRDEAKRVIGTYDYGWPELADATKADRIRQGYSENEPLLRSGALRDSIESEILIPGKLGEIGTDSPYAAAQEYGTSTIPPRSFIEAAAEHELPAIQEMFGDQMVTVWRTGRAP
jgi:HK97 gp10 family phage protein